MRNRLRRFAAALRRRAPGLMALVGLITLAVGAGLYSLPAGLIVFGFGLYIDTHIKGPE